MADFVTVAQTAREPEAPVTTNLIDALYNNPIAIAEGASGAPKIVVAAFEAPTAGSTNVVARIRSVSSNSGTVESDALNVVKSGDIRLTFTSASTGTGSVQVRRLGGAGDELVYTATNGANSVDFAITRGQVVYIQAIAGSGTASASSITFLSGNGGGILA